MRWLLLLLALVPLACRSRVAPAYDADAYAAAGVVAVPGAGVSLTGGQYFSKRPDLFDFAFEVRVVYQGAIDDAPGESGKFAQVQAGVKQILDPGRPRHPYLRYGITWLRANGDPPILESADYFGGFGAVGYEWSLGRRSWVGAELGLNSVNGEGSVDWEIVPQLGIHFVLDF